MRQRAVGLSLAAFSLLTMSGAWSAGLAADANNGSRLASRWCATCHLVAPGQQGVTTEAPPFATIARKPDFDAAKIAFFLLAPHPVMPNMALSRIEAGDLAAYIKSLK